MATLTRKVPSPIGSDEFFSNYLQRMFDDPFLPAVTGTWMPVVEVSETDEAMRLTAELPGIDEKALRITIDNNVLTIAGEKEKEISDAPPSKNYYLSERYYGAFQRSFALPRRVDTEHVKAEFRHGVLTITLPILAGVKGRRIEIATK